MEKKTIGQFIAALRKANGMTQKQLAEKLNVTDKAVSRWERDESYPDLTLIPVIAEIFHVTSDELLRGEKKNVESLEISPREQEKTERQIENMLGKVNLNFGIHTIIAVGIAIIGLIVTMICSIGFDEVHIGFYVGCSFYLLSILSEIIFVMKAWYAIGNNECESASFSMVKKKIIKKTEIAIITAIALFFLSIPLVIEPWYVYDGVDGMNWFGQGIILALVCIIICVILANIINCRLARKITASEEETVKIKKVNLLCVKYVIITTGMVIICIVCMVSINLLPVKSFIKGHTFYNIDDYRDYMETPYLENGEKSNDYGDYDYESICGWDYKVRNKAVDLWENEIEYNDDGSFYSITTYSQFDNAYLMMDIITGCWILLGILSIIFMSKKYRKKIQTL